MKGQTTDVFETGKGFAKLLSIDVALFLHAISISTLSLTFLPFLTCGALSIIPYLNANIDTDEASFSVHLGDMFGGASLAGNNRCNPYLFESRRALFSEATNLLVIPGDVSFSSDSHVIIPF